MFTIKTRNKLIEELRMLKSHVLALKLDARVKNLSAAEVADITYATHVFVYRDLGADSDADKSDALMIYDYHTHLYTPVIDSVISAALKAIGVSVHDSFMTQVVSNMLALADLDSTGDLPDEFLQYQALLDGSLPAGKVTRLVPWNNLSFGELAAGNGIANILTHEVRDYTPYDTISAKISTNYIKDPPKPKGVDPDEFIDAFCCYLPYRRQMLAQIMRTILLKPPIQTFFLVYGSGNDGKSTFFTEFFGNLIGAANVAAIKLDQLNKEDLLDKLDKKMLIYGDDNDDSGYLDDTSVIKQISSNTPFSISRKYKSSITVHFTGFGLQNINTIPSFGSNGFKAMHRRISFFIAGASFTAAEVKKNANIEKLVARKEFAEYMLFNLFTEKFAPYSIDINDADKEMFTSNMLDSNETLAHMQSLYQRGVFENDLIPSALFWASYSESAKNHGSTAKHSKAAYNKKITTLLYELGYQKDLSMSRRPASLIKSGSLNLEPFQFDTSTDVESLINVNAPTNYWYKRFREVDVTRTSIGSSQTVYDELIETCSLEQYLNHFQSNLLDDKSKAKAIATTIVANRAVSKPVLSTKSIPKTTKGQYGLIKRLYAKSVISESDIELMYQLRDRYASELDKTSAYELDVIASLSAASPDAMAGILKSAFEEKFDLGDS